jgi:uncharacterized membrane protein YsdA (DUF1294 family)
LAIFYAELERLGDVKSSAIRYTKWIKDGLYKMLIYIFFYLAIINLATFIVYAVDKYKAIHEQWRISEATLMTMSAVGGSLGGLLAMYTFRHKTKKKKFTVGLPVMLSIQAVLVLLLLECVQL